MTATRVRTAVALLLSALVWLVFVAVTVLTLSLWAVDPDNAETTPVVDLSFFALGAMIAAGAVSQVRKRPHAAGAVQASLAAALLGLCGLLGARIEPAAGGLVLAAAAGVLVALHPQRRTLLHSVSPPDRVAGLLALLAAVAGAGHAVVMLGAARIAGPSCFLGGCAAGDRLAETAATALAVPALAGLSAWRVDGWRLPLWSAGMSAVVLGASSWALPDAPGSLGLLGGGAATAWGVLLVVRGERDRTHERLASTSTKEIA